MAYTKKEPPIVRQSWPPLCVAVTGILGSGKSTVTRLLARFGLAIVDCDSLARDVTSPGGEALVRLKRALGDHILGLDGTMKRSLVLDMMLSDQHARHVLEQVIHPLVLKALDKELSQLAADGAGVTVVEVPLLFEVGWHAYFDINCLVVAPEPLCISRIMKRNGVDRKTAEQWMKLQMPLEEKEPLADYIIHNDGTLDELQRRVDKFYHYIVLGSKGGLNAQALS